MPVPDPHSEAAVDEPQSLFDHRDWDGLTKLAEAYISSPETKPDGHYWRARVHVEREEHAAAYENIVKARTIAPNDVRFIAAHLEVLCVSGAARKAFILFDELPEAQSKNPLIQVSMYWLFRRAEWYAQSRRVWREIPSDSGLRPHLPPAQRIWEYILTHSSDRRLRYREEIDYLVMKDTFRNIPIIDSQVFNSTAQMLQSHSETDSAQFKMLRRVNHSNTRRLLIRSMFGLLYLAGIAVASLRMRQGVNLWISIATIGLVSSTIFAISASLYDRARTYLGGAIAAGAVGMGALTAGLALMRFVEDSDYIHWLAISVLAGAGYSAVAGAVSFAVLIRSYRTLERYYDQNARGWIINVLASILAQVTDQSCRSNPTERRQWVRSLENTAMTVERNLAKQLSFRDDATEHWLNEWFQGVAEDFRHMKRYIIAPSGRSWEHLIRLLSRQMQVFAGENWRGAGYRRPPAPKRRSRKDKAFVAAKFFLTAFVPGLLYLAIAPLLGVEKNIWMRALMLGVASGLLSLLFILDPTLKEKADLAKGMLGGLSPLLGRGDGRPADEGKPKATE